MSRRMFRVTMSRSRRLERLEAAAPSNIPDDEVDRYCRPCLGARGFRRTVELARRRIESGDRTPSPLTCQRCGKPTFLGAVHKVRAELGLGELASDGSTVPTLGDAGAPPR